MIKEQLKCPRCNKVLLRAYSNTVISVTCTCGHTVHLKKKKGYTDGNTR